MTFHTIYESEHGLQLDIDGAHVALVRTQNGCLDLVWQVYGPKELEQSRRLVTGLIDLLITFDAMPKKKG